MPLRSPRCAGELDFNWLYFLLMGAGSESLFAVTVRANLPSLSPIVREVFVSFSLSLLKARGIEPITKLIVRFLIIHARLS